MSKNNLNEEIHNVKNASSYNFELLKIEKYDTNYLIERCEYKRFLEELINHWNSYYYKFKNTKENDYFNFNTYRYDEIYPYISNFLTSYNLGNIKESSTVNFEDGGKKIIIEFHCTTKELVSAIYQELQMLDYYKKTVDSVKKDYQEFLDRDKDRYAKLIPYENLCFLYNSGYISKKNLDMIPANILYRVVNLIEKNNLFITDELNNIDIENYIQALLNIGLTPEMIKFITNFEEEYRVINTLEQGKSR